MKDRQLQYRYFFLTFSATFLLMSIFFLFMMFTIHPDSAPSADLTAQQEVSVYQPAREDAITVLFVGTETAGSDAGTFILARMNPQRDSVTVAVFPPATLVRNGDRTETLQEVHRYGGANTARRALAETLDIPIDRYVRMSMSTFITCANAIGSMEFELEEDLLIEQNGMQVMLHQGRHLLDGRKLADLIGYRGYDGGEAARCAIIGQVTAALINQRIDVVQSTLLDAVFEKIINLIDSDISYVDYDNRREAANYLAQLETPPAQVVPVRGSFEEAETVFTLDDTGLIVIGQAFL